MTIVRAAALKAAMLQYCSWIPWVWVCIEREAYILSPYFHIRASWCVRGGGCSALWPVFGNSVPKLGHEFLLLWLYFHSFSKHSCSQGSKNCGSCTNFLNFWNWNKIEPAGAKYQAWVLGRKSSKPAIVLYKTFHLWTYKGKPVDFWIVEISNKFVKTNP